MRQITIELTLLTIIFAAPQSNAQQRAAARQGFPARPMPPDLVAPPDTRPTNAPKPERTALPQSDQPAKAATQQHPVLNAPAPDRTQHAQARAAAPRKTTARKRGAKPSPVLEPPPQVASAPPPPATPQQMPPSPPQVEYRDGLLTVSAKNSTLLDVLNAIRAQSGANMTLPPSGLNDRLFVQAGPAPPRDVLSKLLAGTNFNYVLVGSPQDPGSLQQVIVTTRQPGGAVMAQSPAPAANPGGYPQQSRLPGMGAPATEEEDEPSPQPNQQPMPGGFGAPGGPGPFQPNPAFAPPGVANPTPMQPTPGPAGIAPVQPPQQPPQGTQAGQPQVKTPEQLLQELKQMQQQQQKPPQE